MRLSDFDYELPQELIAQQPLSKRSDSRLLRLDRLGEIQDLRFPRLADLLEPGDLLIFNDTRVMKARLFGRKDSGGKVEILVERLLDEHRALAHIRASKSPKPGGRIRLEQGEPIEVESRQNGLFVLTTRVDGGFSALMQRHGHMPLPPYIDRADDAQDESRYQTVYASREGAVAAPTAGLHFDQAMLDRLAEKGIDQGRVTLHVGAGTFQPVRVENLQEHVMHSEYLEVGAAVCEQIQTTRDKGGRVVAVGTTSVRSLESAAADGVLKPYTGETRLFITPGYEFRVVDAMITNFHLPESTLLMLVSAFSGHANIMRAYEHAVGRKYRFFSYGDAMFLEKAAAVS